MADHMQIIKRIGDLPTLPDVVTKINRMIGDPKTSAADINDVLSRDMTLSTKILKLVNSPYYGFPRRITTITYAVVILGFNQIRDLALSAFVFDAFKFRSAGFDLRQFWRHALATATACHVLARAAKTRMENDAFMAGLLHDVGKAVLAQFMPDEFTQALKRARREQRLLREMEQDILGYDHALIGGALLEQWNLPKALVAAVGEHHRPAASTEQAAMLVALTHFGDILARALLIGEPGDPCIPMIDPSAWARIGLTWKDVEGTIPSIREQMANSDAFLSLS